MEETTRPEDQTASPRLVPTIKSATQAVASLPARTIALKLQHAQAAEAEAALVPELRTRVIRLEEQNLALKRQVEALKDREMYQGCKISPEDEGISTILVRRHLLQPTTCRVCGIPAFWGILIPEKKFRLITHSLNHHTHTASEIDAAKKPNYENHDNFNRKRKFLR